MQNIKNINGKPQLDDRFVVLLAEEHTLTARIQKNALEEGSFKVYTVTKKEDLILIIKNEDIDILMIDFNFNKNEGIKFISRIKKISHNKHIKIILTSVASIKPKLDPAVKEKIDHFIIKPIPKGRMIEELKQLTLQDTRQFERVELELESNLIFEQKTYQTKIIDVSDTGIHIKDTNHKLKIHIDDIIRIEINLPKYKNPVYFTGKIVRETKEGFGVKIMNMSQENKKKLCKFIEKYSFSKNAETYYL